MTVINSGIAIRSRSFPSKLVLLAAGELTFIALLLRWSNSPAFFAAAVACSLGAIQLGAVLINRFQRDTHKVRKVAQAAEFSNQAVMITDPTGRIKWTNSRFTELTGFALTESAGKKFSMLLHGQLTDTATVEKIRSQIRGGERFTAEILQYNRAGQEIWVSSQGEPFRDPRGQLTHYVITQSDLNDQRRQTLEIEQLAKTLAVTNEIEEPELFEANHPENDPALRLSQQLASLSSTNDRAVLQVLVDGLKSRVEDCVAVLPSSPAGHQSLPACVADL